MRYMGFRRNTINLLCVSSFAVRWHCMSKCSFESTFSLPLALTHTLPSLFCTHFFARWNGMLCAHTFANYDWAWSVRYDISSSVWEPRATLRMRKAKSNANKTRLIIVDVDNQSEMNINSHKLIRCYLTVMMCVCVSLSLLRISLSLWFSIWNWN